MPRADKYRIRDGGKFDVYWVGHGIVDDAGQLVLHEKSLASSGLAEDPLDHSKDRKFKDRHAYVHGELLYVYSISFDSDLRPEPRNG